jgi:hypothetical protein
MTSLTDLKVGDSVAAKISWKGLEKKTIKKITPTYIILEGHSSTKFKKDTGFAIDGDKDTEYREKYIIPITEAIQEQWDRIECWRELSSLSKAEDLSLEGLKEAVVILIKESKMADYQYRQYLSELVGYFHFHLDKIPLKTLKQVLDSLKK